MDGVDEVDEVDGRIEIRNSQFAIRNPKYSLSPVRLKLYNHTLTETPAASRRRILVDRRHRDGSRQSPRPFLPVQAVPRDDPGGLPAGRLQVGAGDPPAAPDRQEALL